jgi:hypothetical protein
MGDPVSPTQSNDLVVKFVESTAAGVALLFAFVFPPQKTEEKETSLHVAHPHDEAFCIPSHERARLTFSIL